MDVRISFKQTSALLSLSHLALPLFMASASSESRKKDTRSRIVGGVVFAGDIFCRQKIGKNYIVLVPYMRPDPSTYHP